MPRTLDLIRNSQVPFNVMHSAAHGSLAVPAAETLEILVYLAVHNKVFGEQARMTLAGWDEKASVVAAGDPHTQTEVLQYFVAPENLRPGLLPALAENPAVHDAWLAGLAETGSRNVVEILLKSQRVMSTPRLSLALHSNPNLRPNEQPGVGHKIAETGTSPTQANATEAASEGASPEAEAADEVVEGAIAKFLEENAAELAAERDKPFQLQGATREELTGELTDANVAAADGESVAVDAASAEEVGDAAKAGEKAAVGPAGKPAAAVAVRARKPAVPAGMERRDSALQKISKLDIKGRIALAMRGNKEDRSILIRDSTKLVALAVLDSPKVSEKEIETFALQKNVLESVLRTIPMRRKFAKNYNVQRNLVYNPRTPLDASLGLMKGLLVRDLKNLSENKDVADTIRKMASRLYRQKVEKKG